MNLEAWDPQKRLNEFRQRSNQLWDEFLAGLPVPEPYAEQVSFMPEVDLVETPDEFRFYLSMPGMLEDDIQIDIEGRLLTIRGERHPPYDSERRGTQLQEWRYGFFERHFELSSAVSVARVRVAYDSGVLTIIAEKLSDDVEDQS